MEKIEDKNQKNSSNQSESAEDNPFANIESLDFITSKFEDKEAKKIEREKRRAEYNKIYKNCYSKFESTEEKTAKFRNKKREKRRLKRQKKKKLKNQEKKESIEEASKTDYSEIIQNKKKEKAELRNQLIKNQKDGMRVVIDCGFEKEMGPKELASLAIQITRCYARIKKSNEKYNLTLLNFKGISIEISYEIILRKKTHIYKEKI